MSITLPAAVSRFFRCHRYRQLTLVSAVIASSACANDRAATSESVMTTGSDGVPDTLASIGDQAVTLQEARERLGPTLERLDIQYAQQRSRMLDSALQAVLSERLVAIASQKEGKSVEEMLTSEAGSGLEPSEVEVAAWYEDNKSRVGGRSLDQIRGQIVAFLRQQRLQEAAGKLQLRLTDQYNVKVYYQPYRIPFNNTGAPTLGSPDAPITLVEFSDFQCPFCKGFAPTLHQVAKEFGDKVLIVYRQFPIAGLHPEAEKAAEASLCAHEQGKFWEMHDVMFKEQDRLQVSSLKEKARRLGMNQKRFDSCLDSGRYVEQIQRDRQEGMKFGIAGTPAVFINGRELKGGAVPFETVRAAIQQELSRLKQSK